MTSWHSLKKLVLKIYKYLTREKLREREEMGRKLYLDNFEMTLIRAPFSSRRRWLSFFKCSSCCKNHRENAHLFFMRQVNCKNFV